MEKSFLSYIAEKYSTCEELCSYCFVFPNKRAGLFFSQELKKQAKKVFLFPEITTISDFVGNVANTLEPSKIELQFILFDAYKNVIGDDKLPFEKFASWADMLLSDFNDVDRYLVDAKDLFRNTKELEEIKSTYLTEEQREFLKEYLNLKETDVKNDVFWTHLNSEKNTNDKYKKLWQNLLGLYNEFNRLLDEKGLSYSGKSYRKAVEEIKSRDAKDFEYKRYVFAGFNMLSASEMVMFKKLKEKGLAEFLWDANSPAFTKETNKAALYIKRNKELFPAPDWFGEPEIDNFPEVNVYSIPSKVGQAKFASSIMAKYVEDGIIDNPDNAIDTAIVLADEDIFMPLLSSLPDSLKQVNVSVGLSIKNSSVVTFMGALTKLHRQSRSSANGQIQYLSSDVKEVLTHPIMRSLAFETGSEVLDHVKQGNLYLLNAEFLTSKSELFDIVFTPLRIGGVGIADAKKYLDRVLTIVNKYADTFEEFEDRNDDKVTLTTSLEKTFVSQYANALELVSDLMDEYKINLDDSTTFLYLVDCIAEAGQIAFEGVPLNGLQIVGMLETRCLDFKNVTILSMNENVFPRKQMANSFIPESLRKSFGMSTIEHQEAMFAYYFYRLISRAERVNVLYDSRVDEMQTCEKSRYIVQLQKLFENCTVNFKNVDMNVSAQTETEIEVKKDERIMNRLNRFKSGLKEGEKNYCLSASSIKTYLKCGLQFYLKYIEDLYEEDKDVEFIEASTMGTIVHDALQQIYQNATLKNKDGEILIEKKYLDSYASPNNANLKTVVRRLVNEIYLKKGIGCDDELRGEALIVGDVVCHYVFAVLKYDSSITLGSENKTLIYVSGEKKEKYELTLGENTFNFSLTIDRVDKVNENGVEYLRIIDYKTGKDETSFKADGDLGEACTEALHDTNLSAIVQVFLYAYVYRQMHTIGEKTIIKPMIYKLRKMDESGLFYTEKEGRSNVKHPILINEMGKGGTKKSDELYSKMLDLITEKIDELFNPDAPFTQGEKDNCKYCQFANLCRR